MISLNLQKIVREETEKFLTNELSSLGDLSNDISTVGSGKNAKTMIKNNNSDYDDFDKKTSHEGARFPFESLNRLIANIITEEVGLLDEKELFSGEFKKDHDNKSKNKEQHFRDKYGSNYQEIMQTIAINLAKGK